jgi:hypothetical protein
VNATQAPLVVTSLSLSAAIQYSSQTPEDPKQDLRPSLHLAGFHRGERVLLIPISVKPFPAGGAKTR